jgi:hypothetical protein
MNILSVLAGLVIGAAATWQLAQGRAAAQRRRLQALLSERICYWQDEAERASASAARLSEKTAAWLTGCQQGRDDVLSLARALSQNADQLSHDR